MSSIQDLAAKISASAATLSKAKDGSEEASKALSEIRSASFELHQASTPAKDWMHGIAYRATEIGAVNCLMKFGVVPALPMDRSISYDELASKVNVDVDVLRRLCRFSCTYGFLREPKPGQVEHTEISKIAAEYFDGLQLNTEIFPPANLKMFDALQEDPGAVEVSSSGFAVSQKRSDGTNPAVWEWYAEKPERAGKFGSFMRFTSMGAELGHRQLQQGFDWKSLPPGSTVVDVGGGKGHTTLALADLFPSLSWVVQDRQEVVNEAAKENTNKSVKYMAHDFFQPQPERADVYFFRRVFHDWSDEYCIKIMKATLPGLKAGAKVIVNEIVLPDPKGHPDYSEYIARRMDMAMMTMVNGKERSIGQWKELINAAEPRLKFDGVKTFEGSTMSVIVFTYE